MSFTVSKDDNKSRIAVKDIICYKTVDFVSENTVKSTIKGFSYTIGKCYKLPRNRKVRPLGDSIEVGFHSYKRYSDVSRNRRRNRKCPELVAIRCVIPAGSTYWKNSIHYVSDRIYIKEIIK